MAHEALVHRVDAQATAGQPLHSAAPGLAEDGVVEVLTWMAADSDVLADPRARAGAAGSVLLDWGRGGLLVDLPDDGHGVRAAPPGATADATLRGDALALDLHLWGRLGSLPSPMRGDLDAVEPSGDPAVIERLMARVAVATQ
jgi:hypothetical protein